MPRKIDLHLERRWAIAVLALGIATPAVFAGSPELTKATLFEADQGGYKMYRIPGIVVTRKGTVLAYAEARRKTGGDWDTIDLVMRRSTDGGSTFSPPRVVARVAGKVDRSPVAMERKQGEPTDVTYDNPVEIADRNGAVHFLFCVEYMRVFYMRSRDDGETFTQPVEITAAFDRFRPEYSWRVAATGPGHGIQLSSGRLLVPVWLSLGTGGNGHHPSVTATVYSDDHGATWHRGEIAVPNTPQFPDPNETTAAQLADGRVLLNVRTEARENRRTAVTSRDGAAHWSPPKLQQDLPDPVCFASMVRLSTRKNGGRNRLLFSNPENLTRADGRETVSKDRKNLTIHMSYDEGETWPVKRTVEAEIAGYSDLAVLPDGTILCLYEAGSAQPGGFPNRQLVLARFNLEWLTEGNDSLAAGGRR